MRNQIGTSTLTLAQRRELVTLTGVTLDGKPARISGAVLRFPMVRSNDGRSSAEFSWSTVQFVVQAKGGAFHT